MKRKTLDKLARGLGWFSVGLGMTELLFGRRLATSLGLGHRVSLVRVFGLREIATGLGILSRDRGKAPWIWARVAGDALDLAVLATALRRENPERGKAVFATTNVAAVTALDVLCGVQMTR
jgi:hypothetical protein